MKKFWNRGAILVMFAIALPTLFIFTGFGIETGQLYMHKAILQNTADAAALAGTAAIQTSFDGKERSRLVQVVPDDAEKEINTDVPDNGADEYLRKNSNNKLTIQKKGTDVFTSLYKKKDGNKDLYYYSVTVKEVVPLFFMRFAGFDKSDVAANAISYCEVQNKPAKDWYHMFHWELAQIPTEERLAYDQHALINMASLFIGRTPKQALKIINPTNPQANENHIKNGKEILILNYQDKQNDDTYIETFIGFGDTRSPQAINWSRDDFGEYNESLGYIPLDTYNPELGHFADMRFFFSDWVLTDMPDVDNNKRTFRISFKLDENGLISEARVRINRKRNYYHELDITVKNDGYAGQTRPESHGSYTDNAL